MSDVGEMLLIPIHRLHLKRFYKHFFILDFDSAFMCKLQRELGTIRVYGILKCIYIFALYQTKSFPMLALYLFIFSSFFFFILAMLAFVNFFNVSKLLNRQQVVVLLNCMPFGLI